MVLLNLMNLLSQSFQPMLNRDNPNKPVVDLDDVPIASDTVSVADSYNPDELDSEHLCHYDMSTTCQQHFQLRDRIYFKNN